MQGAEISLMEDFLEAHDREGDRQVLLITLKASYLHLRNELSSL
jgi:hypothetical protein